MSEWKECTLNEIYDFASGLSKSSDQFGYGFDFVSFKDVFYSFFLPNKLTNQVNSTEKERVSCSVKKGDVFLTRTSETQEELGMSSVALKEYPNATFNGFTKRLRPKGTIAVLPEYAGYFFRSPNFRATVTSMSSMTTRASLNNEMLSCLKITLPDIETQKAIGYTLKALDNKIDLLHRQNATLEAMAETLFRQWFVEEAKEDWEVKPLSSIANFLNGLACQKFPPENAIDRLPVLKIKELGSDISENSDWASTDVKSEYFVRNGDVIFAWSASLMVKIWTGKDCILNQHLFKVTSKVYPKWFYYLWCKHHLAEFISISRSHATTMGHIKRGDLDEAMVLVPLDDELKIMTTSIQPIMDKLIINNKQIRTLTTLRDTLLPKLMSGEVRVKM